jgi:hypothetical protein
LLQHIAMCDVYVTPYLVETQMTSGTLAYSHGLGRPVVSTPYWHALELLTDGSGALVPFGDTVGLGTVVADLLTDEASRLAMGRRAYVASRAMTWRNTALRYREAFARYAASRCPNCPPCRSTILRRCATTRACSSTRFSAFPTEATAIASMTMPARCCCAMASGRIGIRIGTPASSQRCSPALPRLFSMGGIRTRRFRNFMGYDSDGWKRPGPRTAMAHTLGAGRLHGQGQDTPLAQWACALFEQALAPVKAFTSPRAWAFALLGLSFYCGARNRPQARGCNWCWASDFTPDCWPAKARIGYGSRIGLTYDNARLCEALIVTGRRCGVRDLVDAGLRSLRWLLSRQTAPEGHFRPVGSQGFLLISRETPLRL